MVNYRPMRCIVLMGVNTYIVGLMGYDTMIQKIVMNVFLRKTW